MLARARDSQQVAEVARTLTYERVLDAQQVAEVARTLTYERVHAGQVVVEVAWTPSTLRRQRHVQWPAAMLGPLGQ